jgi:tetratricopeptide (TPR) repeat protein
MASHVFLILSVACFVPSGEEKLGDATAYIRRAVAHGKAGEYDKAVTDFSEAIRLEPNNAVAYRGRGLALCELSQFEKAVSDFTEAIRLDPSVGSYWFRGLAYFRNKEYAKALPDCTEAIRLDPSALKARLIRGLAYAG